MRAEKIEMQTVNCGRTKNKSFFLILRYLVEKAPRPQRFTRTASVNALWWCCCHPLFRRRC